MFFYNLYHNGQKTSLNHDYLIRFSADSFSDSFIASRFPDLFAIFISSGTASFCSLCYGGYSEAASTNSASAGDVVTSTDS